MREVKIAVLMTLLFGVGIFSGYSIVDTGEEVEKAAQAAYVEGYVRGNLDGLRNGYAQATCRFVYELPMEDDACVYPDDVEEVNGVKIRFKTRLYPEFPNWKPEVPRE